MKNHALLLWILGIAALAIDLSYWGESDGAKVIPWNKLINFFKTSLHAEK